MLNIVFADESFKGLFEEMLLEELVEEFVESISLELGGGRSCRTVWGVLNIASFSVNEGKGGIRDRGDGKEQRDNCILHFELIDRFGRRLRELMRREFGCDSNNFHLLVSRP